MEEKKLDEVYDDEIDLIELFGILWKRRKLIFLVV